jgi:hypothetical protein
MLGLFRVNIVRRAARFINKSRGKWEPKQTFIVLVCFEKQVKSTVVRISEASMMILFNTWNNKTFSALRPKALVHIPRHCGLNNASHLAGGIVSYAYLA